MQFSEDDLIAFLLDDASSELRKLIQEQLLSDEDLRERVTSLRQMLGHMDSLASHFEPPGDLVDSTMARIDSLSGAEPASADDSDVDRSVIPPSERPRLASPLSSMGRSSTGFMDSIVLCLSLAFLCCLILPSIVSARFQARIAQCSANLQQVGEQLLHFAVSSPDGRFPAVGTDAHTDFSGYYVLQLKGNGYELSQQDLQCSSLLGYERPGRVSGYGPVAELRVYPTLEEFRKLSLPEIETLKPYIGGDYAASLGYLEQNRIMSPLFQGRSHFALLADAPVYVDGGEHFIAHQGRGINIFYEDGRVQFVRLGPPDNFRQIGNYPFQNDLGGHAAGVNPDDSSLAPSAISPYGSENDMLPLFAK